MDGLIKKEAVKGKEMPHSHRLVLPDERNISSSSDEDHIFRPNQKQTSHKHSYSLKRCIYAIILSLILVVCLFASYILYKGVSLGREIQFDNTQKNSFFTDMKNLATSFVTSEHGTLLGEQDGRINILLLGRAGTHYPGRNLTDTIIVMSIDTKEKKVALLSLPRDLYVEIGNTGLFTKINSLYQYGLNSGEGIAPLQSTIENITGQHIHYFFTLDFDGFEKMVDALQGVSLDVVRDFYDPRYPGKNYSYETFEIKKGWQTLSGATALKYVRERHNDPEGDFGRAKRQQQVIQAIKEKAFSLGTFFNIVMINNMLSVLGENVETNMPIQDMEQFMHLFKTLDTKNITTFVVDAWKKESLLRVSHIDVNGVLAFILVPRVGTWNEIQDTSKNIFHLENIKMRKQKIQEEHTSITLIVSAKEKSTAQKLKAYLLEEIGIEKVDITSVSLENMPEKSIIQGRIDTEKTFSLDEVIKKLSLDKYKTVSQENQNDTTDFSIIIGDDLIEAFSIDQEIKNELPEDDISLDVMSPQVKHPKKK